MSEFLVLRVSRLHTGRFRIKSIRPENIQKVKNVIRAKRVGSLTVLAKHKLTTSASKTSPLASLVKSLTS